MNKLISTRMLLPAGVLLLLFVYQACTREYIENINGVCFETEVLPIFQSNCTQSGCHNATDREKGYDLSSYESIVKRGIVAGDYRQSELYRILVQPRAAAMPPKPYNLLTDAQITTVALWIEQGAQNTTGCASSNACDTTNVTFSGSVKPILNNYCTGCHSGSSPSGNIDYSSYDGTKPTALNGKLAGSINFRSGFSAMPQGGSQLSSCSIAIIEKWIELGALNN